MDTMGNVSRTVTKCKGKRTYADAGGLCIIGIETRRHAGPWKVGRMRAHDRRVRFIAAAQVNNRRFFCRVILPVLGILDSERKLVPRDSL